MLGDRRVHAAERETGTEGGGADAGEDGELAAEIFHQTLAAIAGNIGSCALGRCHDWMLTKERIDGRRRTALQSVARQCLATCHAKSR
jgi:hypothetical protein